MKNVRTNHWAHVWNSSAGFSILELIVVLSMLLVVIMISAGAFERIAKTASVQTKSSDSNIQGIIGLEIMRSDLEKAGFGLPWPAPSSSSSITFDFEESQVEANTLLAKGIDPKDFNDKNNASGDPKKTPRAVQSAAATGAGDWENGRDYIVIKSTSVGTNTAAKHWSYLEGLGAGCTIKQWGNTEDDVALNDRVITLKNVTEDQKPYRELVGTSTSNFSYKVQDKAGSLFIPSAGYKADTSDIFLVYGVDDKDLRVPYNRVDYYIKRPTDSKDIPTRCAPGTGILYKANLLHNGGGVTRYPLLDCVADMQVVYTLDTNGDGGWDLHEDEGILTDMTAEEIRNQLQEVRVYILAHEGGMDPSFNYPSSTIRVGDFGRGRDYDLTKLEGIGNNWKKYRWKVYTIVAEPKNINN